MEYTTVIDFERTAPQFEQVLLNWLAVVDSDKTVFVVTLLVTGVSTACLDYILLHVMIINVHFPAQALLPG